MITRIGMNAPDPQEVSPERPSTSAASFTATRNSDYEGDAFSGETSSLSVLTASALQAPEIRQDMVDDLRYRVASRQYPIDRQSIADAMLND